VHSARSRWRKSLTCGCGAPVVCCFWPGRARPARVPPRQRDRSKPRSTARHELDRCRKFISAWPASPARRRPAEGRSCSSGRRYRCDRRARRWPVSAGDISPARRMPLSARSHQQRRGAKGVRNSARHRPPSGRRNIRAARGRSTCRRRGLSNKNGRQITFRVSSKCCAAYAKPQAAELPRARCDLTLAGETDPATGQYPAQWRQRCKAAV
jgi:hypothetical protein